MAVSFDGETKIISVDFGVTELTTVEIYSAWKEWVQLSDNSKFQQAMSALGGDPIAAGRYLGSTFFLENNWKLRPHEADHVLTVSGNLFTRDGASPFISTLGDYNVLINLSTSNLVDTISTGDGGGGLTAGDIQNIAANSATKVWDKQSSQVVTANSMGEHVKKLVTKTTFIALNE